MSISGNCTSQLVQISGFGPKGRQSPDCRLCLSPRESGDSRPVALRSGDLAQQVSWSKSPDLDPRGGNLQIAVCACPYGNLEIPARLRSDLEIWRSGERDESRTYLNWELVQISRFGPKGWQSPDCRNLPVQKALVLKLFISRIPVNGIFAGMEDT